MLSVMAVYPSKITVFFMGFAIGVIIAFITVVSKNKFGTLNLVTYPHVINKNDEYDMWMTKLGYKRIPVNFDYFIFSGNKTLTKYLEFELLKAKVNVLCVMFIHNINNAYAAMNTWMRHCNTIKFYSTKSEKYLDVTVMRSKNSWHYLCDVIRHVHDNFNDYMWVLFVPDDVFAIPENLRRYVFSAGMKFEAPYYLGHSGVFWNEQYNLAQAGYVLSKGSIIAISKKFTSSESCQRSGKYWKNEDFYLGKHLSELGVTPSDTRDGFGRGRFHLFTPAQLLAPGDEDVFKKYWKTSLHPVTQGFNCCSPQSITFQGTHKTLIYFYYYLLYNFHLHREAGHLGNIKSRSYNDSGQVWEQFVLDELGPQVNLSSITPQKYYKLWQDKIDSPSIFNKKLRELFLGNSDD